MTTDLLVVTALRSEYTALRGTVRSLARCGMGAARVREWLPSLAAAAPQAVAIAGVAGGLDPAVRPGDVVVADEVRDAAGRVPLRAAAPLAAQLRAMGLRVHVGPVVTSDHLVDSVEERAQLATCNALAVDMESAPIARAARELPGAPMIAVVRVVVDTTHHRLVRPSTVTNGVRALATLRRLGPELEQWADLAGPRTVLLAGPRSFCAGVERAIDIVEKTLERHAHPVYVRRQIVHNAHVVKDLERRGAAFVHELDEVPDGATVVFSAHGVAPAVREEADRRGLRVIDATCPLVAKVHAEARRFARRGDTVLFVGHAGHDETEGTLGEVPGRIALVSGPEDAAEVEVENPERVSYLLQTTLAVDDAAATVDALRRRFPALDGPTTDDICYATTNRQRAVTAIAEDAEVVLVVGSANSSNSLRLVEVVRRQGHEAHLVEDVTAVRPEWLRGVRTVGVTAGASAPPHLVDQLVETLRALGPVEIEERVVAEETITFTLPKEVSR